MATTRLARIVFCVPTPAVRHVLTAAVVPRARLGTGDQRATMRVVQGVRKLYVT